MNVSAVFLLGVWRTVALMIDEEDDDDLDEDDGLDDCLDDGHDDGV